jgi:hypothetical protein
MTIEEIRHELQQGNAYVYKGCVELHYHQPAGLYRVEVIAHDDDNNWAIPLENHFEYFPLTKAEIDFSTVNYGSVEVSQNKWAPGNNVWDDGIPSVRNVGNTDLKLTVEQDDMGIGQSGSPPVWDVVFDARIGVGDYYAEPPEDLPGMSVTYDPFTMVEIPDVLHLCNTHKMDFSIHVKKATLPSYTGTMTIGWIYESF